MSASACVLCGGTAGTLIDGAHALCAARHDLGLETPCLGIRCARCNGAGTTGKGGVALFFSEGPARIARSIAAQFPPCQECGGKGYTTGEGRRRTFAIGARVSVLPSHWNPTRHGEPGTVKSVAESSDGKTTHWVGFDTGGGEFIHAEDLRGMEVDDV